MPDDSSSASNAQTGPGEDDGLLQSLLTGNAGEIAPRLAAEPPDNVATLLQRTPPEVARTVLDALAPDFRSRVIAAASEESRRQWVVPSQYAEGVIGRLMQFPIGVFRPEATVGEATEQLRELVKRAFITYGFVTDPGGRLLGVFTMRDLLFSDPAKRLEEVMLTEPFSLQDTTPFLEAMRQVVNRHFPVYPVCDAGGRLVGLVRGHTLFEAQAFELSAQAGSMVGVDKEERPSTHWLKSLKFRHPWLQLNLLTAFVAAAVVGAFQGTIEQLVILSVFLPVLMGQSGNTGCQALAVTLRGLTLGELKTGAERALVAKEALLGVCNGMLVGLTAGIGMVIVASLQHQSHALLLGLIVFLAMTASCVVSGISGVLVPITLKRLGADPATASSIFLTTATDVASMTFFLGLATLLVR